jgi:shikimate kinase
MIVVLMGYMGSGKSTIGKELARILKFEFIDLDEYISDKEAVSIPEIFAAKGEIYFRKKETLYLNEILNAKTDLVLALGGGTPCYASNLKAIISNEETSSFYLKLSIPSLAKRLFQEKQNRPLISHINTTDDLTEFIGKHLFERAQFYSQAQFVINTDGLTQKDVLEDILLKLI